MNELSQRAAAMIENPVRRIFMSVERSLDGGVFIAFRVMTTTHRYRVRYEQEGVKVLGHTHGNHKWILIPEPPACVMDACKQMAQEVSGEVAMIATDRWYTPQS